MLEQGMRTRKGLTEQILVKKKQGHPVARRVNSSSGFPHHVAIHFSVANWLLAMIHIAADLYVRHLNNDRSSPG